MRYRVTPVLCDCSDKPLPVMPAVVTRCPDCVTRHVPAGPPEWHTVTTEVPTERGSAAVPALRVSGSAAAA
jgi:hypothetical protein